jgi:hypothetical protein
MTEQSKLVNIKGPGLSTATSLATGKQEPASLPAQQLLDRHVHGAISFTAPGANP